MKKSKTCPKCESKSISFVDRIYTGGGFGGNECLGLDPKVMGGMKNRFTAHICNNCGYSELYIIKD